MDIEKFIPNDKSVLDALLNNNNDDKIFEGTLEDFLKLPTNEQYENNQERLERERTYIKKLDDIVKKDLDNNNNGSK
jgi:hypothetical protein